MIFDKIKNIFALLCFIFVSFLLIVVVYETYVTEEMPTDKANELEALSDKWSFLSTANFMVSIVSKSGLDEDEEFEDEEDKHNKGFYDDVVYFYDNIIPKAYAEIKDRPDNNGDKRPHAKIKDPKDYYTKLGENFDQPSVSGTKFLAGTNATDVKWGWDEEKDEKYLIIQNSTLMQPVVKNDSITRILELQVNFTNSKFDLDTLQNLGYHLNLHIKSDRYMQWMQYPIGEQLATNNKIYVPIVNNTEDTDDGGDFRIDVSVNQFDNKFEKATYASMKNQTSDSVNIDDMLEYVIEDEKEEGNYVDNAGIDRDGDNEDEEEQDESEIA